MVGSKADVHLDEQPDASPAGRKILCFSTKVLHNCRRRVWLPSRYTHVRSKRQQSDQPRRPRRTTNGCIGGTISVLNIRFVCPPHNSCHPTIVYRFGSVWAIPCRRSSVTHLPATLPTVVASAMPPAAMARVLASGLMCRWAWYGGPE